MSTNTGSTRGGDRGGSRGGDSGQRGGSGGRGGSRGGDSGGNRGGSRGGDSGERRGSDLIEKVVQIRRCAAVVKGGRRFSFSAIVVVGDGRGRVGWGYGKANEVPPSVEKATKDGSRKMVEVSVQDGSIPHTVEGRFGASHVILVPASAGTGVIAGSSVRAVCEAAGIHNILTKSFGSTNPANLVKATIAALTSLQSRQDVERLRGVSLS